MQSTIRKMLEIMPIEVQHRLSTKYGYTTPWPSSGILAIIYCLEKYRNATCNDHRIRFHGWKFRPLLGKSEEERDGALDERRSVVHSAISEEWEGKSYVIDRSQRSAVVRVFLFSCVLCIV